MDKVNYSIANIGLSTDGTWFVTYLGNVPEQGGIEFKNGQLYFHSLSDACEFLKQQVLQHEEKYKELVEKKK